MDSIGVRELRLWAHVGVLEHELRDGQWFSLDFSVQFDLKAAAVADDLSRSLDYSLAIQACRICPGRFVASRSSTSASRCWIAWNPCMGPCRCGCA